MATLIDRDFKPAIRAEIRLRRAQHVGWAEIRSLFAGTIASAVVDGTQPSPDALFGYRLAERAYLIQTAPARARLAA